jgi:hypothetical protein
VFSLAKGLNCPAICASTVHFQLKNVTTKQKALLTSNGKALLFDSMIQNSRCNMNPMFHRAFIVKHAEIVATLYIDA